jgi:hypothetical protein
MLRRARGFVVSRLAAFFAESVDSSRGSGTWSRHGERDGFTDHDESITGDAGSDTDHGTERSQDQAESGATSRPRASAVGIRESVDSYLRAELASAENHQDLADDIETDRLTAPTPAFLGGGVAGRNSDIIHLAVR